jgi:hypothetical protein
MKRQKLYTELSNGPVGCGFNDATLAADHLPLVYRELTFSTSDNIGDMLGSVQRPTSTRIFAGIPETILMEKMFVKEISVPYTWYDVPQDTMFTFSVTDAVPATTVFNLPVPKGSYPFPGEDLRFTNALACDNSTSQLSDTGLCGVLNRLMEAQAGAGYTSTNNVYWVMDPLTRKLSLIMPSTYRFSLTPTTFSKYLGFNTTRSSQVPSVFAQAPSVPSLRWIQADDIYYPPRFSTLLVRCPEIYAAILGRGYTSGHNIQGVILEVPVSVTFGGLIRLDMAHLESTMFMLHGSRLARMTVDLLWPDGTPIELNNVPWSITFGLYIRRHVYADQN